MRMPSPVLVTVGFVEAPTLDELAEKCGIDAANLAQTVARYNELCASGEDAAPIRGRTRGEGL